MYLNCITIFCCSASQSKIIDEDCVHSCVTFPMRHGHVTDVAIYCVMSVTFLACHNCVNLLPFSHWFDMWPLFDEARRPRQLMRVWHSWKVTIMSRVWHFWRVTIATATSRWVSTARGSWWGQCRQGRDILDMSQSCHMCDISDVSQLRWPRLNEPRLPKIVDEDGVDSGVTFFKCHNRLWQKSDASQLRCLDKPRLPEVVDEDRVDKLVLGHGLDHQHPLLPQVAQDLKNW